MIVTTKTENEVERPVCRACRALGGRTHSRVRLVYVLSGRRAWDEVTCRRCGVRGFFNFR